MIALVFRPAVVDSVLAIIRNSAYGRSRCPATTDCFRRGSMVRAGAMPRPRVHFFGARILALVASAACGQPTAASRSEPTIGNAGAHHVAIAVVGPTRGPAEPAGSAARAAVAIAMADVRDDGSRA